VRRYRPAGGSVLKRKKSKVIAAKVVSFFFAKSKIICLPRKTKRNPRKGGFAGTLLTRVYMSKAILTGLLDAGHQTAFFSQMMPRMGAYKKAGSPACSRIASLSLFDSAET
jgi:hypothetical protein